MAYERWTKEADIKLFQLVKKHEPFSWGNWGLIQPHFPNRELNALKQRAKKLSKNPPQLPPNLNEWPEEDLKLMSKLYIVEGASFKQMQEAISIEASVDEIEQVLEMHLRPYRQRVRDYAEEHNIALKEPITSTKLKAFFELKDKGGLYKSALKTKLESYG